MLNIQCVPVRNFRKLKKETSVKCKIEWTGDN